MLELTAQQSLDGTKSRSRGHAPWPQGPTKMPCQPVGANHLSVLHWCQSCGQRKPYLLTGIAVVLCMLGLGDANAVERYRQHQPRNQDGSAVPPIQQNACTWR